MQGYKRWEVEREGEREGEGNRGREGEGRGRETVKGKVLLNKPQEEEQDEDDGKEPRTIGQGEMVNTPADDVGTMVDDQPIGLPEQGREMREHTPRLQPLAPAPRPQTLEPHP